MCLWYFLNWQFIPTYICTSIWNMFGKTLQSSFSSARWLSSSHWTSLTRPLVQVSSAASHLHSSIHVMMCTLHEYLTLHLLTALLHFTRSANAGDMSETVGMYVPSLSSCHPSQDYRIQHSGFCSYVLCTNVGLAVCTQYVLSYLHHCHSSRVENRNCS